MMIGAGLPPVPHKLVSRIQAGEYMYVDMAELLPHRLGLNAGPPLEGDKEEKKAKTPTSLQHYGMDPVL